MTDVRIVSAATLRRTVADWLLQKDGTLDESNELANVVKVALMTDRLAAKGEVLPDPDSDDRRGWWADANAEVIWRGWSIGTKNWLLTRAKISDKYSAEGDTVYRAEAYTREALSPMITNKMCSRIEVSAERVERERINVRVMIYRGPEVEIELRFQSLWDEVREY